MNKKSLNKILIITSCIVLAIVFSVGVKTAIDYKNNEYNDERPFGATALCDQGEYIYSMTSTGQPVCYDCPAGSWCDGSNKYTCQSGYYQPNTGKAYCLECSGGTVNYDKTSCVSGIGVAKPTSSLCNTGLVYNGSSQTITRVTSGQGYTLSGTSATNVGSHTVTATLNEGYMWNDYTSGSVTFTCSIAKAQSSVTLSPTSATITNGSTGEITATVKTISACKGTLTATSANSSNLAITSNASSSDIYNSSKKIGYTGKAVNVGTYINVSFNPGDTQNCSGSAAVATIVVKNQPKTPTITFTDKTVTYTGNPITHTSATTNSDGAITYDYFEGEGCLTGIAGEDVKEEGIYSVKAKTAATSNYLAGSKCVSLTINKYTPKLSVSPSTHTLLKGKTSSLAVSVTTIDACKGTLTATSGNSNYVKITNNASVSNVSSSKSINYEAVNITSGTNVKISFKPNDTANCNTPTDVSSSIIVREPEITNLAINKSSVTVKVGGTVYLTATISKEDGTTEDVTASSTWSSNDGAVVFATGGRIDGKGAGDTTVLVTFQRVVNGENVTFSRTVNVNVEGVAVDPTITFNDKTVAYTGNPITHESAVTNSDGKITYTYYQGGGCASGILSTAPTNVGNYSVRVTIDETANYKLLTKCVGLTINKYTPMLSLSPSYDTVNIGKSDQIVASIATIPACKGTLTAKSSNSNYVKITNNSSVSDVTTSKSIGYQGIKVTSGTNIEVSFKPNDTTNCNTPSTVTSKITVEDPAVDPTITFDNKTATYTGSPITHSASTNSDGEVSYTYHYGHNCDGMQIGSDEIVDVDNYSIRVFVKATEKYHAGNKCANITINKYSPQLTVSPTTHNLMLGASSTLAVSVKTIDACKGTLTTKSGNTNYVSIKGNTSISDVSSSSKTIEYEASKINKGSTNINVSFKPNDTANCNTPTEVSSSITVREPEITNLAINKNSVTVKVGGVVYLTATISKEDGTTEDVTASSTWSSNDGAVVFATGGKIEGKSGGKTTVLVSFSRIVNGEKITLTREVTVNVSSDLAVAPTITFNDKTTPYTGSPIQHKASTNSDGKITHTYYQGAGCMGGILSSAPTNVGSYSVRVTIDESANYLLATKCVNLTINKYEPTIVVTPVSNPVKLGEANSMFVTISTIEACKGTLTATSKNTNNVKITSNANNTDVASSGKIIGFKGMKINSGTDIEVSFKPNDSNNCKAPQIVSQKVIVENPGVENTTLAISCNPTTLYLNSAVAGSTSCQAYFTDTNYDVTNQSAWYVNGNLVNERGSFKPTATGEYTISVSHTDGAGDIHKAKININVLPELEEPTLTFDNKTAVYNGNPVTHSATSNSNGTITYIYYSGQNCSGTKLSNAPINAGNYSVKAIQDGTSKYDAASKCVNLTINKYTPSLIVSPTTNTININDSEYLLVTVNTIPNCTGTLVSTSSNTSNVSVISNANISNAVSSSYKIGYKGLIANSRTNITVSFKPNDLNNCETPVSSNSSIIIKDAVIPITSISLDKNNVNMLKGDKVKLTATVVAPSGADKTVTWTSSNNSAAEVDANGNVSAIDVGTAIITAKAGGKSASCSVTVSQSGITVVAVNSLTLNKNSISLIEGNTETLIATVNPTNATNKTVTWISTNNNVAKVDANGKVTAVNSGTATITAEAGGKSASCLVNVLSKTISVSSISINKTQLDLSVGDYYTLIATVLPVDATNKTVVWRPSNDSIVTVSDGKVYAKAEGTATVTATAGGKSATCKINVSNVLATSISLNITNLEMKVNDQVKLIPSFNPSNVTDKSLTWKSSDTSVATVDNNGNVTGKSVGTTTVTVKTSNNKSASATVKVIADNSNSIDVTSLTKTGINTSNKLTMNIGDTLDLAVLTNPNNATNKTITWKTSDDSYVSVSGNGLTAKITAKKATVNDIVVTATSSNGKSVQWLVEVKPNKVLTLFPNTLDLKVSEKGVIKPLINGQEEDVNKFNWSITSGTSFISVDSSGIVTAKANGTAKVKVSLKDDSSVNAICTVNVSGNLVIDVIDIYKIGSNTTDVLTMYVNDTLGLQVELNPKDATNQKITWTTSDSNYVSISPLGKGATITAKKITTNNIVIKATASNGTSVEWHVSVIGNAITNKPELYSLSLVGDDYIELNKSVDIKAIVNATGGSIDLDWSIIEGKDYAKITKKGDMATISLTSNAKVNDTIVIKACGVEFSNICNTHTLTVKDNSNNNVEVIVPSTGTNIPIIIVGSIIAFTVFGGALIINYRKKFN